MTGRPTQQAEHPGSTRILGLNALRFLCALCVVQGHLRLGNVLILNRLHGPAPLVHWIRLAFSQGIPIPTGPNAVIVFFVISGFCIHFPYRDGKPINVRQFIVRRYIRIGIPAVLAAVVLYITGFHSLQDSVLWSIVCEIIYYSLYPFLMTVKRRLGWHVLLGASFAAACLVVASKAGGPYNGDFPSLGIGLTWIVGLPCWVLGCLLAETYVRFGRFSRAQHWCFRIGIVLAACAGTALRFYAGIGYYWTQPVLAVLIYFWLGTEISRFSVRKPWAWLEGAGAWSYSVYLYHAPIAIGVGHLLGDLFDFPTTVFLELIALLVGCYLLYLIVERPAHMLARRYVAPRSSARLASSAA